MKPTLLIAESDPELNHSYWRFLSRHGHEVENASDGLECLEQLCRLIPSVLVLDWELRWGGGDGVLAWLREENAAEVPVILMATAGSSPAVADLRPPVVLFLPKPFALAALLESVPAAVAAKGGDELFNVDGAAVRPDVFIGLTRRNGSWSSPLACRSCPSRSLARRRGTP